jgi:hypothetical protein
MSSTIPFSEVVQINPGVLSAGGAAIDLNGVMLTQNSIAPYGQILQFANAAGVISYFGATSVEAQLAAIYFNGYTNCTAKPGILYMFRYPETAIAAFLSGGSLAGMTLAQLQSVSGSMTVSVDGYTRTANTINLSSTNSFSAAAGTIQTALNATLPTGATVTGSIAGTTLTVTTVVSGTLSAGQTITGGTITAGTIITGFMSGTSGGVGTYSVNNTQTAASTTVTATGTPVAVAFSSTSNSFVITSGITGAPSTIAYAAGTLATALSLTQATGATQSQGAAAATPASFMPTVLSLTQNWACFMTVWESVLAEKEAFAAWSNSVSPRYLYVSEDSDVNALSPNNTECFGFYLSPGEFVGSLPFFGTPSHAAFVMGYAASLNFTRLNGRTTLCFRSQSGLTPSVTNATDYAAALSNGYNMYGAFGGPNPANNANWATPGSVSGDWLWVDSYLNQIWLNANLQLAMVNLLEAVSSIPYNAQGDGLVYSAALDPINAAINFGAIRKGITLSAAQIAEIQFALGFDASASITANGFYLQIAPTSPATRQLRQSPPITLYYTDGQSIQQIVMASIEVM